MTLNKRQLDQIIRDYNEAYVSIRENYCSIYQDILSTNQSNVTFTGERLVLNDTVKHNYAKVYTEHILRYELACHFVPGKVVLDAACGIGYGTKMIESAGALSVTGIDISEESIHHAASYFQGSNIRFSTADIHSLPFDNESFDIVVSFETIEHIPSGCAWIHESSRVLKNEGWFIVSTPNRTMHSPGTYSYEKPRHPYHYFEYSTTEFIGELLLQYDIVELYGQTFVNDHEWPPTQFLRQSLQMNPSFLPSTLESAGYQLVPFSRIKNAHPTFVVAICRKKSRS